MTIGHDDPLATMTLDEVLAWAPVPTPEQAAEFSASLMDLASDEEREWFRERIVGERRVLAEIPGALDLVRAYSGLAINARDNAIPFRWVWENIVRTLRLDDLEDPGMVDGWDRIRDAMAIMATPGWRP